MLSTRIIPCLDVRDGRVVKGTRFRDLRDSGSPVELAARYQQDGADELVLLDISATEEGRGHAVATVRAVRADLSIPLCVGGAVRSVADAERLLEAGADKIGVNSAAVDRPALLTELATQFGRQCVTVSIDAARVGNAWEVFGRAGRDATGRDAVDWASEAAERGAGEILLTSIDRDGTREGYDIELIRQVARSVTIPVIASGGARHPDDFIAAVSAGADALLAASLFHDGDFTVTMVKQLMRARGMEIRP